MNEELNQPPVRQQSEFIPSIPKHENEKFSPRDTANDILRIFKENEIKVLLAKPKPEGLSAESALGKKSEKLQELESHIQEIQTKLGSIPQEVLEIMFNPTINLNEMKAEEISNFAEAISNLGRTWQIEVDDQNNEYKTINIYVLKPGGEISDDLEKRARENRTFKSSTYYDRLNSAGYFDKDLAGMSQEFRMTTIYVRGTKEFSNLNSGGANTRGELRLTINKEKPAVTSALIQ